MATLYFKVSSDYQEVIRLRQECEKLEAQLKKMDVTKSPAAARALETQLASTRQQMIGLVTEAANAGAVMEHDFKNGIYNASQTVNNLSANITSQRSVIRQLQNELTLLKEKYRETVKSGGDTTGMSEQIKARTIKLREQKDVLFGLTQQQAEARLSVKRLKDEYAAFKEEAGETVEANEKMSVSLTKVLGVIGGVTALKNFATELVNVRGQFQQLEIAFSTMLKSNEKADKLMSELVDIAAKTPFDLQGVASSAKQMLAYGSSAENVGNELVMLGNVAAGVGSQLSEIAYLYGTLRTQGRAYAVDIRQFAGRGIPIYEELAKVLGVTKDEVSGLVTEGKVGFKEVEQAFKNMTSESGIYYNLMEEQSKSLTGQLSNLGDAWDTMLNEIGKDTQGIASAGISGLKGLIENYETIGKVLVGLIAVYGTYKTALIVVRIAQDTLTARMELAILVTKAQTMAQKALNTVMKANPYVLVATVLSGLVATMWALHDSTTESEKAQQKFNEEQKKFANQEEERKKKIEELIRIIQDETETELSKIKAYEELQRYSPALSSAYTREQLAVLNLAEANKELNKERDKNSYENILKNIQQWEEKIKSLNASLKNAGQGAPLIASQIESAKANLNKWESALSEYNRLKKETEENSKPVEVKLMEARSNREQIIREYNIARQILQEEQEKIKNFPFATIPIDVQIRFNNAQAALKGIDGTIYGLELQREASGKPYQQAYKEAKAVYEAKLKAVEDAKKGTESAYKKAVEELETAEKNYKALGGVTGSSLIKQENQAKKETEQQKKERQQLYDELLQLRFKNQQDEINLMEDGREKKRKQLDLDYQMEYTEIQKLEKEWSAKNDGKLTQEQSIEISRRYTNAENKYDNGISSIDKDKIKEQEEAWNEALIKYGTYQQKRKALTEKYDKEIAEAENAGTEWVKTEEKKAALESLDEQYGKSTHAMADLFEDASEKSVSSIQKIIDKYELLVQYMSGTKQSDNTYVTVDELKAAGFTEKDIEKIEKGEIQIKDVTDAVKGLKGELKGKSPWQAFVSDMEKGIQKLKTATGDSQKVGEGIMNIGDAVTSFAPALGEFGNNIASIFNVEDSNITEITNAISGLGQTAAGVGKIMSGDIVGGAMSAVGGIASVVGAFRAIHDKKNEKQIQKLQDQIDVLDKSYEKLGKSIEKAYSTDASELIEQQNEMLEQQKILIQNQIKEEQDKKKTDDNRIKEWQEQLDAINEQIEENGEKAKETITGTSIMSAIDEFAQAYADAWANGTDAAEASTNAVKNLIKTSLLEFLKKQLSPDVEKFMSDLANYMSDGIISPWEDEQLNKLKDKMDETASNYYNQVGGYFKEDETKEQQSASGRGFGTEMTHEDAGELSGRFTAVYESNLRIETATQQQTVAITELKGSISGLISQTQSMYNIADETRTILANSYLELQEIRENTGEIIKPIKQMQEDIAEVKRNTSRL